MKLTTEHQKALKDAITPLDTAERRARYAGLSDKRYRWDLLWAAKLADLVVGQIYKYANDDHIDTVLRRIVPPLN